MALLPVSVQQVDEGAALGAALQAMWMHQPSPLVDLVDEHLPLDTDHTRQPEQAEVDLYNQHYEQYRRHVGAVSALYR
jgi:xylulokinase